MSEFYSLDGEKTQITYRELDERSQRGLIQVAELVIRSRGLRLGDAAQSGYPGLDESLTEVLQALRPPVCDAYGEECPVDIRYENIEYRRNSPDVTDSIISMECPKQRRRPLIPVLKSEDGTPLICEMCHSQMRGELLHWLGEVADSVDNLRDIEIAAEAAQELADAKPIPEYIDDATAKATERDNAIRNTLKIK